MPQRQLKAQLESLEEMLNESEAPLTDEERESLQALATNIKARLLAMEASEEAQADPTLVDGVNLMIGQLSVRHPTVAATLRSVAQTLSDMGI
ncbi:MAG TPA: DUF4404 family protein [Pseudomonas xinjiangensis]|uniref:DUF4404 family protein n=2 Tax=root TaxID=1 RepID=A0A7V1BQ80_9GAMM|nr:DUF4404 family protein [Halopseudomonas xinjiangensis]HEC48791.1 DUF4404 family protein [Halopseudomonas xinjiangensis]